MIVTKEVKIRKIDKLTSEYIEKELKKLNLDILCWSIIDFDKENYILNLAIVC